MGIEPRNSTFASLLRRSGVALALLAATVLAATLLATPASAEQAHSDLREAQSGRIDAGAAHTCAIYGAGSVRCWGEGDFGRLGYGNVSDIGDNESPSGVGPVDLGTGRTALAIATGAQHTCALLDNHTVRCWGEGDFGRLGYANSNDIGDNETPGSVGPVDLGAGRTAVAITAGDAHTCAVLDDGTVRCWGEGANGRLGYANTNDIGDNETPGSAGAVNIGIFSAVAISAGGAHTCVVRADASARCWGEGDSGRLGYANINDIGDNETPASAGSINLGSGRSAVAIAAGGAHTCAIMDDANVRCWGEADFGRVGYGDLNDIGDGGTPSSAGPVNLGTGRTARAITTGALHTCAVLDNNTERCWGEGDFGRLGYANQTDIGDNETPNTAGPVSLGTGRTAITTTAGGAHTCTLLDDGNIRCWGDGANGRLGYANTTDIGDTETPAAAGPVALGGTVDTTATAPTAVNDTASKAEDSGATAISVLTNDTDSDGGTKLIASTSDPANGTVVITGGGTGLTYAPDANYCNGGSPTDNFTYTLNGGSTATVSVTVTCVDDNPVAVNDSATKTEDSGATAIAVLANDTDIDGGTMLVQSASDPANGTVVITGGGTGLTYAPDANYCNDGAPPDDTFTYTLNGGSTATVSVAVTCVDDSPVAVNDSATKTEDSGATAIDVLANDTDIDGGTKLVQSASDPTNGTVVITGGGTGLTYQPDPNYCNGGSPTDDFTYTLNGGSTATVSVTVSCVDDMPVAVNDSASVAEDSGGTSINVLSNDTDVDGGTKTVQSTSDPANGTVAITGGGTGLTYQPDPNYCNGGSPTDDFTYTLNGGSTATVSVTVSCVDDIPVAVDDSASFTEDDPATTIDVLANDTDIDGGPKQIASATQPDSGTVVVAGDNLSLTYEPDPNYCNDGALPDDTFTYTLNGGSTATVSVAVTCVDDLPTAIDDSATVAKDDGPTAIDVLANDTDPDGGPKTISSASDPAHGTVVITGGGSGLTYEPDPGYCDDGTPPDTFTYMVNGGSEATVSMTVSCTDDPPTAVDDTPTVAEGSGATAIDVLANDDDPDGGPRQIQSTTDPANGTVVITGGGSGLTYEPDPAYCNDGTPTDDFTYALNGGSTATVSMTVSCFDDPPTAIDDSPTVLEDSPAGAIDVFANDTDSDGGPKLIQSVTQPNRGTVAITGGGSGLTYEPDPDFCNNGIDPDDFTYTLNGGSEATVSVTITCVDDNPTAIDDTATTAEDSGPAPIDVLTNDDDPDGGPMTIQSASDPANGAVVITGGGTGLTYQPDPNYCNDGFATDDFTYTVNGGSQATVFVAVNCVEDDPIAVNDSATKSEDSGATSINVLANDTDIDGGTKLIQSASDPANGTVVVTGGGTGLSYAPDANYCNDGAPPDDTFTYTLNGGSQATVSVAVNCVDDNPLAVNDSATVMRDSGAVAIGVLANDTDVDGGPKTIQSASNPANGTVVITGGGSGLTYEPDAGYCNDGAPPDDTFTYTLNGGSQATVSMTVTCTDLPPTAVDDSLGTTQDAAPATMAVLANDPNPDGGPMQIQSATDPANGTVVITGGGSGLTYEPDPGFCNSPPGTSPDTFTYTLNGGSQATVSVMVACAGTQPPLLPPTQPPLNKDPQKLDVLRVLVPNTIQKMIRKGVRVQASCRLDCRIVVRVTVTRPVADAMGLRGTVVARGSSPASAGELRWVIARVSGAAARALRSYTGGGRLQLQVDALEP